MNYCTLADGSYLSKLLCLVRSMEKHVEDYHLFVLALDDEVWSYFVINRHPDITVARLESIESGALLQAKADKTHQEYCWLLASQWTLRCMLQHQLENMVYLDADAFFMASPKPVFEEIGDVPVAIPPHRFAEKDTIKLENGIYNVCFVYFSREGLPCLREWADYTLEHCYHRPEDFADQACWNWLLNKYNGHAIQHLGCDLAPWNQEQYEYALRDDKIYVNGVELILYHAHELLHDENGTITRMTNWKVHPFVAENIYPRYERELQDVSG